MPLVNVGDPQYILYRFELIEQRLSRLEVNAEINAVTGNETTLPIPQDNKQPPSTTSSSATWNCLGAKPKNKSHQVDRRLTGRIPHLDDTAWPALSRNIPSSTPAPKKGQQAAAAGIFPPSLTPVPRANQPARAITHPVMFPAGIPLTNRFAALQQEPSSDTSPPNINKRYAKRPTQPPPKLTQKPKLMPKVLIVGDSAVNGIDRLCNMRKTKVLCFPNDTVSDVTEKIVPLIIDHPSIENLIIHIGANDLAKKKSEILKKDFSCLLSTIGNLKMNLFISGPIPRAGCGDENYSRLLMINRWLIKECSSKSVNFIDNHKIFWERYHLFRQYGSYLNKEGQKLFTANIFNAVNNTRPSPPTQDNVNNDATAEGQEGQAAQQDHTVPKQADNQPSPRTPAGNILSPTGKQDCSVEDHQDSTGTQNSSLEPIFLKFSEKMDLQLQLGTSLLGSQKACLLSPKPPDSGLSKQSDQLSTLLF